MISIRINIFFMLQSDLIIYSKDRLLQKRTEGMSKGSLTKTAVYFIYGKIFMAYYYNGMLHRL
jgi:hypothetical protein